MIGPYYFRERLNGQVYLNFLRNILPMLLEEVNLQRRQNMWLQQDVAPHHFHRDVRHYLEAEYANKWIGMGSMNPWPPRTSNRTPLDYFLWGLINDLVYRTYINSREDLEYRTTLACRSVTPAMLMRVRRSFWNRIEACESGGQHFEYLLK